MPATISINGLYQYDNTLINGMVIPPAMNKAALINYIISECAELELAIPRPDTLKIMIESWSLARLHSWIRLYESTVQDYNMIHNYDRYEEWTDHGDGTSGATGTTSKAGYNGGSMVPAEASGSTVEVHNDTTHEGHLYGKIGVTTAAQMLQGERDINTYDVYMAITDEFKHKFCVCVY